MRDQWSFGYDGQPLAVMPGGNHFVFAGNTGLETFRLSDMGGPIESYTAAAGESPGTGITTTSAGPGYIAATQQGFDLTPTELWLWEAGTTTPSGRWQLFSEMYERGVAFSPDATKVFAVGGWHDSKVVFFALDTFADATRLAMGVETATTVYGNRIALTATIDPRSSGHIVSFYRKEKGSPREFVGTDVTNARGVATRTAKVLGTTWFSAEFAGTAEWQPSDSRSVRVRVRHLVVITMQRSYDQRAGNYLYHQDRRVFIRVDVRPAHPRRNVDVTFTVYRQGQWWSGGTASFRLGAAGIVLAYFERGTLAKGRYSVSATMTRDAQHLEGSSPPEYFRVTS